MPPQTYHHQPDYGAPPGYVLEDYLEAWGLTPAEFAGRHSLPAELVAGVVAGRAAIDPELARILEQEFGLKANFWLAVDADYRRHLELMAASDAAAN